MLAQVEQAPSFDALTCPKCGAAILKIERLYDHERQMLEALCVAGHRFEAHPSDPRDVLESWASCCSSCGDPMEPERQNRAKVATRANARSRTGMGRATVLGSHKCLKCLRRLDCPECPRKQLEILTDRQGRRVFKQHGPRGKSCRLSLQPIA